ncbi:hypothetical protein TrVE_jg11628 [Triparma verrucosa]|uniref:Methyltransferase domain-containing protein n=1 Tax=Triparma verrucosa TaxID=1606542 RepID=A0A9W7B1R8_9STRA|nr:hypothetical protein TrVE_jg11628 [Triparma verrucosa]
MIGATTPSPPDPPLPDPPPPPSAHHDAHGFWDDFYEKSADDTDWILSPSETLTESLSSLLPEPDTSASIPLALLEIGCGTSLLSERIATSNPLCEVIATDVSPVAIAQCAKRSQTPNLTFCVLDCITLPSPLPSALSGKDFSVILDKGCLDTFLFRLPKLSRPSAIQSLLNNVHALLSGEGVYIVMSPRKVIKELRDYKGFKQYTRKALGLETYESGELDGGRVQSKVFLHRCEVDETFDTSVSDCFRRVEEVEVCGGCGKLRGEGGRKWVNHVKHCRKGGGGER